ncbi:MAG: NUDIX hydrolase [Candidatus Doudnabacteria bacterium]|nr:NUDIX hydrolase [Candidatus Doudnabacteria bacterium]
MKPKSAYTILTTPNNEILFLGRADSMTLPKGTYFPVGLLDLPGGTFDHLTDESMLETAIRETGEETGLQLQPEELELVGNFGGRIFFYRAQLSPEQLDQINLGCEHIHWQLVNLEQLMELGFKRELKDEQSPIRYILPLHADVATFLLLSQNPELRSEWHGFDNDFLVTSIDGNSEFKYIAKPEQITPHPERFQFK